MKAKFTILFFLLIILGSCEKDDPIEFTLYLNFNTSEIECESFSILVDDQVRFDNKICFAGVTPCFKTIKFRIEPGLHVIEAFSENGEEFSKLVRFTSSKQYGYLTYHSNRTQFDFYLSSSGGME